MAYGDEQMAVNEQIGLRYKEMGSPEMFMNEPKESKRTG